MLAQSVDERLLARYALQTKVRALLLRRVPHKDPHTGEIQRWHSPYDQPYRIAFCGRQLAYPAEAAGQRFVPIYRSPLGTVHYGDLLRCGSVWLCPVCASKISERRRAELETVLQSTPYQTLMLTFTFSHQVGDDLRQTLRLLAAAWRTLVQGAWWQGFKRQLGWVSYVRSLELTWGAAHGFHPHLHLLAFFDPALNHAQIKHLEGLLRRRWQLVLAKHGLYADFYIGLKVDSTDARIARYLAKFDRLPSPKTLAYWQSGWGLANELTKQTLKRSPFPDRFAPFDLAAQADFESPGGRYLAHLFRQYAQATWGRHQLEWSRKPNLRAIMGLTEAFSDQELLEENQQPAQLLFQLDYERQWRPLVRAGQTAQVLLAARWAAEQQDDSLFWSLVYRLLRGGHDEIE
jgi:hypothetical protein